MDKVNGGSSILCATVFSIIKKANVSIESFSSAEENGKFKIILKTTTPELISEIKVPIWRDSNQNDIVWYTGTKLNENSYQVIMDISNHKFHIGDFNIHVYAVLNNGIEHITYSSIENIYVSNYMYVQRIGLGKYTVNIINPNFGNVQQVEIPTWSETNGQDDLVWYNANFLGDGVWSATISTVNHRDAGIYISHAYGLINGEKRILADYTFTIPQSDMLTGMDLKAQNYSSSTDKLILVDLTNHRVGIYSGSYQNWINIQSYVCTVGAPSTPTITGEFSIYMKRKYFDSGSSRCFYFSPFKGGYGFHSVLYYQDSTPQRIMDGRLGMDLSHGCVRLDVNHAKWIYDNCSIGTKVVVYR